MRSPKKALSVIFFPSKILTDFIHNVKFSKTLNIEKTNEGLYHISEILWCLTIAPLFFLFFVLLKSEQMNQNLIYCDILSIKTVLTYKYSVLKSSAFH